MIAEAAERNWMAAKATFEAMQAEARSAREQLTRQDARLAELERRLAEDEKTIAILRSRVR